MPGKTVVKSGFDDFDRIFDNLFKNAMTNLSVDAPSYTGLALSMDVSEDDKAYFIHADLPGVNEKDISIELNEGLLSISGEKLSESEDENKTYHRTERRYGSFKRSLQLPSDANEDKISAKMKNGVLEIEIQKLKEAQKKTKKIEVKS
jgi:HSP20 family protein